MSNYNLTKIGLIFFIVGIIMGIIPTGIFYFVDANNFGATLGLGAVAAIGAIFIFVALIIIWVGGIGLKEFGKKHSKFCLISLILFLVAIGAIIAVSLASAFSMVGSLVNGDFSAYKTTYLLTPVSAIFMGLVYLFLLHELEDSYGKIVLYISFITMILVSCIIAYIGYTGFDEWYSKLNIAPQSFLMSGTSASSISFTTAFQTRTNQLNVFSIIPSALLLAAAILPLYRILTGKLKIIPKQAIGRNCLNCGFNIPAYSETCPKCGQYYGAAPGQQTQSNLKFCPNCGHKNEEGKTFCEECGVKF